MGHNTLGVLPRSKAWGQVVMLLDQGAPVSEVISQSAKAVEKSLLDGTRDPVFIESVRLLLNIPLAARSDDLGDALRQLNLSVTDQPDLMGLLLSVSENQETVAYATPGASDMGEIAGRALHTALDQMVSRDLPGLFTATPDDLRLALRKLSGSRGIAELTRSFFGTLLSGSLNYWLDRTLATHIGEGRRFASVTDRVRFDGEMRQMVFETTRIIQEFSGGWYGKRVSETGQISQADAARFGAVCIKKILSELRLRVPADVQRRN